MPLNHRLAETELEYILRDSGAHTLVADGPRQATVDGIRAGIPPRRFVGVEGAGAGWEAVDELVGRTPPFAAPAPVDETDVAILKYTSGTTGRPKGVMLTHASSVRLAICGGSPVPVEVLRTMSERGIPMLQGYGLTETSPVAIFLVAEHALAKIGSCGRPPLYVEARIVDRDGRVVARDRAGTPGGIQVRGPNVSVGYWNNPEATAAAFDEAGWFRTGDVGQYDEDGFCYVVDRLKDMVISGGENVYPTEVENVVFEHPAVREVAVIGLPHERWGAAVTAVVALEPGHELSLDELRSFCDGRLARYKLPLHLVVVDALPRNATGKVLKVELRREPSLVDG